MQKFLRKYSGTTLVLSGIALAVVTLITWVPCATGFETVQCTAMMSDGLALTVALYFWPLALALAVAAAVINETRRGGILAVAILLVLNPMLDMSFFVWLSHVAWGFGAWDTAPLTGLLSALSLVIAGASVIVLSRESRVSFPVPVAA